MMVYWVVFGAILLVVGIVLEVVNRIKIFSEFLLPCVEAVLIIAALCIFIVVPFAKIGGNQKLASFQQQAEYFVNHSAKSEIEDAAITNKKIELNAWLYEAQYAKRQFSE